MRASASALCELDLSVTACNSWYFPALRGQTDLKWYDSVPRAFYVVQRRADQCVVTQNPSSAPATHMSSANALVLQYCTAGLKTETIASLRLLA